MSYPIKKRLWYRFERFMAKGGFSFFIFLLLGFLTFFAIIVGLRALILFLIGPVKDYNTVESFWDHMWYVFLQMTDPGNMYQDSATTGWIRITTVIAGFVGVTMLSALIAFITTGLDNMMYNFRKGRGKLLEENHTLILGWNDRVIDILKELISANESKKNACIVILSEKDNEEMEGVILKQITNRKTTKIITSNGNPSNINELNRVCAGQAKSIIVLSRCSDNANLEDKLVSDTQVIKSIMALVSIQGGVSKIPIVAEIFTEQKKNIVNLFEHENIIALDSWNIMGKLLVQTSLSSGLEMVYNEILSFDLSEVYFYRSNWNNVKFRELTYHFKDGIPLGIHKSDGGIELHPDEDYVLKPTDEILILAKDDSTIQYSSTSLYTPKDLPYTQKQSEKQSKNVLILGWHPVGNTFVKVSHEYLKEGSDFDIVIQHPDDLIRSHIKEIDIEYPGINIRLHEKDSLSMDVLKSLNPYNYDTILILNQDPYEQTADKVDSETLMILLMLRKIAKEEGIVSSEHKTKVITQVLDSDNQDLIIQSEIDDFIISNKLITKILAQLSEEPKLIKLFDNIFQEDGSEIYVKPATLYFDQFPVKEDFATILGQARKRSEICLGLRFEHLFKDPKTNFGVVLNPPKDQQIVLTEKDFLVVLAENEL